MSNKSKLLFFDIDGTLVDFDGKLPESTISALRKAQKNGHKIFICSGRSKNQIYPFLLDMGFDGIIGAAGGYVEYQGQVISHDVFGVDQVKKVIGIAEETGASLLFQSASTCATTRPCSQVFTQVFTENLGAADLLENDTFSTMEMHEDFSAFPDLYPDTESCIYCRSSKTVEEMDSLLGPYLKATASSFKKPDPHSGEITIRTVNKATGMQHLLDFLGVERQDTLGFGDGPNDLDMLKFAGLGVAMGNAQPQVKEIADYITDDIKADGLAKAMEHFDLI